MSFPLYHTLLQKSNNIDTNSLDKNKIIKYINQMDQDGMNKIYALIKYHSLIQKCEFDSNNLVFDFDVFSEELQKIIWEFVKIHIKYMKQNS